MKCEVCGARNSGACIQCRHGRCANSYHATCGLEAGFYFSSFDPDFPTAPDANAVEKKTYCRKHSAQIGMLRTPIVKNPEQQQKREQEDEELDEQRLKLAVSLLNEPKQEKREFVFEAFDYWLLKRQNQEKKPRSMC